MFNKSGTLLYMPDKLGGELLSIIHTVVATDKHICFLADQKSLAAELTQFIMIIYLLYMPTTTFKTFGYQPPFI